MHLGNCVFCGQTPLRSIDQKGDPIILGSGEEALVKDVLSSWNVQKNIQTGISTRQLTRRVMCSLTNTAIHCECNLEELLCLGILKIIQEWM